MQCSPVQQTGARDRSQEHDHERQRAPGLLGDCSEVAEAPRVGDGQEPVRHRRVEADRGALVVHAVVEEQLGAHQVPVDERTVEPRFVRLLFGRAPRRHAHLQAAVGRVERPVRLRDDHGRGAQRRVPADDPQHQLVRGLDEGRQLDQLLGLLRAPGQGGGDLHRVRQEPVRCGRGQDVAQHGAVCAFGEARRGDATHHDNHCAPVGGAHWTPSSAAPISWNWQLQGTVPTNTKVQVFDIDGFDNSAATVAALHAQGTKVICYIDFGTLGELPPRLRVVPGVGARVDQRLARREVARHPPAQRPRADHDRAHEDVRAEGLRRPRARQHRRLRELHRLPAHRAGPAHLQHMDRDRRRTASACRSA